MDTFSRDKNQRPKLNIVERFDNNPAPSMWEVYHAAKEREETGMLSYNTFASIVNSRTNPTENSLLIVATILGLDDPEFLKEQGITENIAASMISNLYDQDILFRFEETGIIAYDSTKYEITIIKIQK